MERLTTTQQFPPFYSNVRKQPTFRDLACVQTPSPQQKLEKGRQPLLRFLLRGRGGVCTQTIRDLSVGFETWRLIVIPTLLHERANGSYCKSLIAYINEIFIDQPTATFAALFCNVRMGNT